MIKRIIAALEEVCSSVSCYVPQDGESVSFCLLFHQKTFILTQIKEGENVILEIDTGRRVKRAMPLARRIQFEAVPCSTTWYLRFTVTPKMDDQELTQNITALLKEAYHLSR